MGSFDCIAGEEHYLTLNRSEIVINTKGIIPPLDAPCSVRPTMSIFIEVDRAHRMELAVKDATAARSNSFLPQMSDSFAHIGAAAVLARR